MKINETVYFQNHEGDWFNGTIIDKEKINGVEHYYLGDLQDYVRVDKVLTREEYLKEKIRYHESEIYKLEKELRNERYLTKLRKSTEQIEKGEVVEVKLEDL